MLRVCRRDDLPATGRCISRTDQFRVTGAYIAAACVLSTEACISIVDMSLSRMQVLSIGMIFFVGVMSNNPKHASWGLWTIFGTTALGAVIAGMYVLVIAME